MTKLKKTIARSNLPIRLPVNSTVAFYLLLDRIAASGWAWGVFITLFGILWITAIICIATVEEVDVLKDKP